MNLIFRILSKTLKLVIDTIKIVVRALDKVVEFVKSIAQFFKKAGKKISGFFKKLEEFFQKFKEYLKRKEKSPDTDDLLPDDKDKLPEKHDKDNLPEKEEKKSSDGESKESDNLEESSLDEVRHKEGVRISWFGEIKKLTTTEPTRIGSWMSLDEYAEMVKTKQLQQRSGGLTHILLEGKEHYTNIGGKIYVEFDIPSGYTITRGSGQGWGIFYSSETAIGKLNLSRGLNVTQPNVSNIKIIDLNGH